MTDQLYLHDAEATSCTAEVAAVEVDGEGRPRVALDRTVMYATGGGQPHDEGTISGRRVIDVVHDPADHDLIWHTLAEGERAPAVGDEVEVVLDTHRRHCLMRTHTAMHILCGVMWRDHGVVVTGGNMEPLAGRLDFEFPEPPDGFREDLEAALNDEVAACRPISVSFLPRGEALADDSLIRTKVNLVPESVAEIRVVDIEGLDRQADGGTHVGDTSQVGGLKVAKVQSKGKGYRRVRLEVLDGPPG
ncbi:MAG: alanyl-tRNA editing protein [Actinomycetia bacterium]|nr:alanyl-tRNA editing protein [Actinomycetes bacterium]